MRRGVRICGEMRRVEKVVLGYFEWHGEVVGERDIR